MELGHKEYDEYFYMTALNKAFITIKKIILENDFEKRFSNVFIIKVHLY